MSSDSAKRRNAIVELGADVLGLQHGDARLEVVLVLHAREEAHGRRVPCLEARQLVASSASCAPFTSLGAKMASASWSASETPQ